APAGHGPLCGAPTLPPRGYPCICGGTYCRGPAPLGAAVAGPLPRRRLGGAGPSATLRYGAAHAPWGTGAGRGGQGVAHTAALDCRHASEYDSARHAAPLDPTLLWQLSLSRLGCTCIQGLANRELWHKRWRPRCLLALEARQA